MQFFVCFSSCVCLWVCIECVRKVHRVGGECLNDLYCHKQCGSLYLVTCHNSLWNYYFFDIMLDSVSV